MPDGTSTSISVDFKDVWNAVTGVTKTLTTNVTENVVDNAFMIPRGASRPDDLLWPTREARHLHDTLRWTSWASRNVGTDETLLKIGVFWYYDGHLNGRGRYIGNLDIYAVANPIMIGYNIEVSASLDNPLPAPDEVAEMTGQITIRASQYAGLNTDTTRYQFQARGDGAGRLWKL